MLRAALLLLLAAPAAAEVDVSGSFRVRPGLVDGQVRPLTARSEAVVEIRTILSVRATTGAITWLAEMRDSRAYGNGADSALVAGDVNTFEPVQLRAAIDLGDVVGGGGRTQLVLGRTALDLGGRRLLSLGDYRNAAGFFTGAHARLETEGRGTFDLFWAMPQTRQPVGREAVLANRPALDRERLAQQVFGMVALVPISEELRAGVTVVGLAEKDRPDFQTRSRRLWTVGPRLLKEPARGQGDFEIEAFVQGGEAAPLDEPGGPALPVRSGMVRAAAGLSGPGALAPRLAAEFDYVSGDTPGGRYGRFDQLFGARRFEFGPSSIYGVLGRANLLSPALRFSVNDRDRVQGWVVARALWAASATDFFSQSGARDASGDSGRFAGAQVDTRILFWVVPGRLRADFNATGLARRGVLEGAAPGRTSIYVASAMEAFF